MSVAEEYSRKIREGEIKVNTDGDKAAASDAAAAPAADASADDAAADAPADGAAADAPADGAAADAPADGAAAPAEGDAAAARLYRKNKKNVFILFDLIRT